MNEDNSIQTSCSCTTFTLIMMDPLILRKYFLGRFLIYVYKHEGLIVEHICVYYVVFFVRWIDLAEDKARLWGSCEHNNGPTGFVKFGEFLE
jgi:hypothetical protein